MLCTLEIFSPKDIENIPLCFFVELFFLLIFFFLFISALFGPFNSIKTALKCVVLQFTVEFSITFRLTFFHGLFLTVFSAGSQLAFSHFFFGFPFWQYFRRRSMKREGMKEDKDSLDTSIANSSSVESKQKFPFSAIYRSFML